MKRGDNHDTLDCCYRKFSAKSYRMLLISKKKIPYMLGYILSFSVLCFIQRTWQYFWIASTYCFKKGEIDMLEWIIAILILLNFTLVLVCIIFKRSRDWNEKMWLELANSLNRERIRRHEKSDSSLVQHQRNRSKESR